MGKIRVKTIGDEEKEQKAQQKEEARLKAIEEAKAKAGVAEETAEKANPQASKAEKAKTAAKKSKKHSTNYLKAASQVEKTKKYSLTEALALLPQLKTAKFDETVELHINTTDKGISGSVTLPHGTGKETRVVIANATEDPKAVDELVKKIEAGQIDFDVLIATPDAMPKLARVARVLGPKGLMPNPKNGTVSPKPEELAKKFAGGQINFKTEAKFPILHMAVGKVSFGDKKLADNIKTAIVAVKVKNIKDITLKSTMSPGMKLETASL
jgi:large subunit ribosomal protein L1